jgi:hypothetical protein
MADSTNEESDSRTTLVGRKRAHPSPDTSRDVISIDDSSEDEERAPKRARPDRPETAANTADSSEESSGNTSLKKSESKPAATDRATESDAIDEGIVESSGHQVESADTPAPVNWNSDTVRSIRTTFGGRKTALESKPAAKSPSPSSHSNDGNLNTQENEDQAEGSDRSGAPTSLSESTPKSSGSKTKGNKDKLPQTVRKADRIIPFGTPVQSKGSKDRKQMTLRLDEVLDDEGKAVPLDKLTPEMFLRFTFTRNPHAISYVLTKPAFLVTLYHKYISLYYARRFKQDKAAARDLIRAEEALEVVRAIANSAQEVDSSAGDQQSVEEKSTDSKQDQGNKQEKPVVDSQPSEDLNVLDRAGKGEPAVATQTQNSLSAAPIDWESELDAQQKYFPAFGGADFVPRCLTCGGTNHNSTSCPSLTCRSCNSGEHFTHACPSKRRCEKCGERGHPKLECPEKLGTGQTLGCDICKAPDHLETACHYIWRSYKIPANIHKVDDIPINCYSCGSSKHYGLQCGIRNRPSLSGGITWSMTNRNIYVDPSSADRAISAGKDFRIKSQKAATGTGFSIKGMAKSDPIDLDSDDDEAASFLRPPVHQKPPKQKPIRFNAGMSSSSGPANNWPSNLARTSNYQPPSQNYQSNYGSPRYARERTFSPPPKFQNNHRTGNDGYIPLNGYNGRQGGAPPNRGNNGGHRGGSRGRGRGRGGGGGGSQLVGHPSLPARPQTRSRRGK